MHGGNCKRKCARAQDLSVETGGGAHISLEMMRSSSCLDLHSPIAVTKSLNSFETCPESGIVQMLELENGG
jgi:hypothetical protein